jgi:hypothetical protein
MSTIKFCGFCFLGVISLKRRQGSREDWDRMRLPFPVHIPIRRIVFLASVLLVVQLMEHTGQIFAICSFLFVVVAGVTFNVAGGFSRTSGAYVFFYSLLAVIVGLVWKAVLREPADSHLIMPERTIQVFLGGITAMLIAVVISRKFTLDKPLLGDLVTEKTMQNATVGCMVTGLTVTAVLTVVPHEGGGFLSALAQINRFLPMALILGTIHQIRRSGGKRSISVPVLISGGTIFASGVIGFSKEGMFTPFACWLVAAASQRYRMSRLQLVSLLFIILFMFRYLVPYSQYGRSLVDGTFTLSDRVRLTIDLLTNLPTVREEANAVANETYSDAISVYFNTPQGFMDRLQMISVDDGLIDATERNGMFGLSPIILGFQNLVPHVLWKDKPVLAFGNLYAHEIGGLPEDDFTTGISFSPSGEAYHIARWYGIFIVAPLLWIMLFTLFDSLCGDTRAAPWGLLVAAAYAHTAPEGMLGGVIYALGFVSFGLVVAAWSAAYVMPLLGSLIKGPEQIRLIRIAPVRGVPRRPHTLPRADS